MVTLSSGPSPFVFFPFKKRGQGEIPGVFPFPPLKKFFLRRSFWPTVGGHRRVGWGNLPELNLPRGYGGFSKASELSLGVLGPHREVEIASLKNPVFPGLGWGRLAIPTPWEIWGQFIQNHIQNFWCLRSIRKRIPPNF